LSAGIDVTSAAEDEMWLGMTTGKISVIILGARGGLVTNMERIIVHGNIFSSVMATVFTGAQKACKKCRGQ